MYDLKTLEIAGAHDVENCRRFRQCSQTNASVKSRIGSVLSLAVFANIDQPNRVSLDTQ